MCPLDPAHIRRVGAALDREARAAAAAKEITMPLEYMNHRFPDDTSDTHVEKVLNEMAPAGWRVHTAYSPTHYLLERGSNAPPPRAQPSAPTGPGRGG